MAAAMGMLQGNTPEWVPIVGEGEIRQVPCLHRRLKKSAKKIHRMKKDPYIVYRKGKKPMVKVPHYCGNRWNEMRNLQA